MMHEAVKQSNFEQVKLLIQNGYNVNSQNENNVTPLHMAVKKKRNKDIVKLLLQNGADVNLRSKNESTPLHLAAEIKDNIEIMELLLFYGADVQAENGCVETPLHLASYKQCKVVNLKFLLNHGAQIDAKDCVGETPLHSASEVNNIKIVEFLLANGANANTRSYSMETPLHRAALHDFTEIIELLIQHGANLNVRCELEIPAIFSAIFEGHEKTVRIFVDNGADMEIKNADGESALNFAAHCPSENVFQTLIYSGADINSRDNFGRTSLYQAAFRAEHAYVEMLLKQNPDFYCDPHLIAELNAEIEDLPEIRDSVFLIRRHLIKMKLLKRVSEEIFTMWEMARVVSIEDLQNFELQCNAELTFMREELIVPERRVCFEDLLMKSPRTVGVYLNVREIEDELIDLNFDMTFPAFSSLIKNSIEESFDWAVLLRKSYKSLQFVLEDFLVPHVVLSKVMGYFEKEDMKALIAATNFFQESVNCM